MNNNRISIPLLAAISIPATYFCPPLCLAVQVCCGWRMDHSSPRSSGVKQRGGSSPYMKPTVMIIQLHRVACLVTLYAHSWLDIVVLRLSLLDLNLEWDYYECQIWWASWGKQSKYSRVPNSGWKWQSKLVAASDWASWHQSLKALAPVCDLISAHSHGGKMKPTAITGACALTQSYLHTNTETVLPTTPIYIHICTCTTCTCMYMHTCMHIYTYIYAHHIARSLHCCKLAWPSYAKGGEWVFCTGACTHRHALPPVLPAQNLKPHAKCEVNFLRLFWVFLYSNF